MAVNHQTFYQVDKKDKKEQANFLMCFITLVGKKPAVEPVFTVIGVSLKESRLCETSSEEIVPS